MGGCGRLIGDGTVAQGHAHNGCHVSLGAKHMDGDPSGLPCEGRKRVRHSSLQIRAQVHTTLQRSCKVLPDAWHFLCKTKSAAQSAVTSSPANEPVSTSSIRVCTPPVHSLDRPWLSHPDLTWPLRGLAPAPSSAWSSHPRPSPSCSGHSAQVPPPDDLETCSSPHHPACFTAKSPDSILFQ